MPSFLNYEFLNNTIINYALFIIALLAGWTAVRIVGHFFFKRFNTWADESKTVSNGIIAKDIRKYLLPAAYFTVFYLSTKILVLGPALSNFLSILSLAFIIVMGAVFISSVGIFIFNRYWESRQKDAKNLLAVRLISGLIKIFIWGIAVILFLDNIGIKISSLIAGLGIGGIAVAFAAQTILTDVFCFFTIFFDRPFEIGDYIEADNIMGTVEHIGVKTTRLRALSGEQLVISNTDLTGSRIKNYKTMEQRRVLFTIRVTYNTPHDKLKEIPTLMRSIIENVGDTKFARSHFVAFGDSGLSFDTAYFILSNDYDQYLNIHQEVNLGIKDAFEKCGIDFAFPTQTVQLFSKAPIISTKNETL